MRNSKNLEIFWQTASSRTPGAVAIESAISCAMTGIPHGGCRQLAAEYHSVFQTKRRRTACQREELVFQLSRSTWYIRLNKQENEMPINSVLCMAIACVLTTVKTDSGDMEHTPGDDWRNKNTETHLLLKLQDWLHVDRISPSVFGDYEQILVELIRIGQQNR